MTASFEFSDVERFCAGTVGEPGSRIFFLQVAAEGALVSLKIEKQQVAALAEYLARILDDLAPTDEPVEGFDEVHEPVVAEWAVGAIGVAIDEDGDRIVLMAEAVADPDDADADLASLRAGLTRVQIQRFVDQARDLVARGRPLCQLCGGPKDPEGHVCPRLN
ncbi:MAG: DUF3090 family protein [Acidimicrobiales bacterium]